MPLGDLLVVVITILVAAGLIAVLASAAGGSNSRDKGPSVITTFLTCAVIVPGLFLILALLFIPPAFIAWIAMVITRPGFEEAFQEDGARIATRVVGLAGFILGIWLMTRVGWVMSTVRDRLERARRDMDEHDRLP